MTTLEEMIEMIGISENIDTGDWYGKYLALGAIHFPIWIKKRRKRC